MVHPNSKKVQKIKKALNLENYFLYSLMDELNANFARIQAVLRLPDSEPDAARRFWEELERNDLIAYLIKSKPLSERLAYLDTKEKALSEAVKKEKYEDAARIKRDIAYFKHEFGDNHIDKQTL